MESMVKLINTFKDRRIIVTGHTGFKGSWLTLWLSMLGAKVTGISLDPKDPLDAYYAMGIKNLSEDLRQDIREFKGLFNIINSTEPEIIFHLAAQPLVSQSYLQPLETLCTNIMGTANLLEACRLTPSVKTIIVITTDKCYENTGKHLPYNEDDRLGGEDPYSSSKAAAELVVNSYRKSFFSSANSPGIATARAGNIIGGGDWAENRIVPDCIRALKEGRQILIRNPTSVRPWQNILEPLYGYIILAEKCFTNNKLFSEAWNFGPECNSVYNVWQLGEGIIKAWGSGTLVKSGEKQKIKEADYLSLNINKAKEMLSWTPVLTFQDSVGLTVDWYKAQAEGKDMLKFSIEQIENYMQLIQ